MDAFYLDGGAMVIDPNNSSVIHTGGYGYYYDGANYNYYMIVSKSTDQGTTWERDTLATSVGSGSYCYALAIDRSDSNIVYAGGYSAGTAALYKTTDGGLSWFSSSTGLSSTVYDIKVASTKANTIYAGTSSGVYKSTNAGSNWTSTGLSANVQAVLINPSNENEIYAATTNGIYKSTTGGGSWAQMNTGLLLTNTTSLGIYQDNWLFCGTNGTGMYRWSLQVGAEENDAQKDIQKISLQIAPNPFRNHLVIRYMIPDTGCRIKAVEVYDATGRLVRHFNHLTNYQLNEVMWSGDDDSGCRLPSGVYFIRLEAGDYEKVEKAILFR